MSASPLANPNPNEVAMNITNGNADAITIQSVSANWTKLAPSQKLSKLFFKGTEIWNISDVDPPSSIPASDFVNKADITVPGNGSPQNFVVQFQDPLEPGDYSVSITFDVGCPVSGSLTVP